MSLSQLTVSRSLKDAAFVHVLRPIVWLLIFLCSIEPADSLGTNSTGGGGGGVIEYCEGQTFSARCGEDEVVVIQSAVYGRMRLGRCISAHANLGCERDILDQFDSWCSGQRRCEVRVSSIIDSLPDNTMTCTRDFRGYLEASYACVKVVHRHKSECSSPAIISVKSPAAKSGFIASIVTEETDCGSTSNPWILQASPGQRILVRMFDFSLANQDKGALATHTCQVYSVIKEQTVRTYETICRAESRDTIVYTSLTNQVEIRIMAAPKTLSRKSYFLFKYEVFGCPDLEPVGAQWIRRTVDLSMVGCNGTTEEWKLLCEKDKWVGQQRNCTTYGRPSTGGSTYDPGLSFWVVFTGPQWAAIAVVLAIAVTLGLVIFLVGLLYLKRRRVRLANSRNGVMCTTPHCSLSDYHINQCPTTSLAPGESGSPFHSSGGTKLIQSSGPDYASTGAGGENDYFRTWQLQRHSVPGGGVDGATISGKPVYRQYPNILQFTLSSPCPGDGSCAAGRLAMEHIYESPKFERRDAGSESFGPVGGATTSTPGHVTNPAALQYYELDSGQHRL